MEGAVWLESCRADEGFLFAVEDFVGDVGTAGLTEYVLFGECVVDTVVAAVGG